MTDLHELARIALTRLEGEFLAAFHDPPPGLSSVGFDDPPTMADEITAMSMLCEMVKDENHVECVLVRHCPSARWDENPLVVHELAAKFAGITLTGLVQTVGPVADWAVIETVAIPR